MPVNPVTEQVPRDVRPVERLRECLPLVDDSAHRHVSAAEILVRGMVEVAVCVRIVQSAVLAEGLHEISPLHPVQ